MLVCRLELWKKGSTKHRKLKGIVTIINDGTGSKTKGNYRIILGGADGRVIGSSRLVNFPRTKLGALDLLFVGLGSTKIGKRFINEFRTEEHENHKLRSKIVGVNPKDKRIQRKVSNSLRALGWFK